MITISHLFSSILKYSFSLVLIFLFSANTFAGTTRWIGGSITYQMLDKDKLEVNLELISDCNSSIPEATKHIKVFSPGCMLLPDLILYKSINGDENISPLCPRWTDPCGGTNSEMPVGFRKTVYTGVLDLLKHQGDQLICDEWVLSFTDCCRYETDAINKNEKFYLETKFNRSFGPVNHSPHFLNETAVAFCDGFDVDYNLGVFDPDGDSLAFSFQPSKISVLDSITYPYPLHSQNPIKSHTPIQFNLSSGTFSFKPNGKQMSKACLKVEEFRNGRKIGEVDRDIMVVILDCDVLNNKPVASGFDSIQGRFDTIIEPGKQFLTKIYTSDPDINDPVSVQITANFPLYNIGITSGLHPEVIIKWTPAKNDIGNYWMKVKVFDDGCPIIENQEFVYKISVKPAEAGQGHQFRQYEGKVVDVDLPLIFEPDGPEVTNNTFGIPSGKEIELVSLSIFSPFGKVLFDSGLYAQKDGWDGTYMGQKMPSGTYLYFLEGKRLLSGEKLFKFGQVRLIRN